MSDTCRLCPPFGDPWPSCLLPSQCVLVIFDYEFIFLETQEVFEAMLSYKVCEGRDPRTLFIAVSQALLQCLLYEVFNKYLLNDVCILHSVLILFIYMSISSTVLIMPQIKKFFLTLSLYPQHLTQCLIQIKFAVNIY